MAKVRDALGVDIDVIDEALAQIDNVDLIRDIATVLEAPDTPANRQRAEQLIAQMEREANPGARAIEDRAALELAGDDLDPERRAYLEGALGDFGGDEVMSDMGPQPWASAPYAPSGAMGTGVRGVARAGQYGGAQDALRPRTSPALSAPSPSLGMPPPPSDPYAAALEDEMLADDYAPGEWPGQQPVDFNGGGVTEGNPLRPDEIMLPRDIPPRPHDPILDSPIVADEPAMSPGMQFMRPPAFEHIRLPDEDGDDDEGALPEDDDDLEEEDTVVDDILDRDRATTFGPRDPSVYSTGEPVADNGALTTTTTTRDAPATSVAAASEADDWWSTPPEREITGGGRTGRLTESGQRSWLDRLLRPADDDRRRAISQMLAAGGHALATTPGSFLTGLSEGLKEGSDALWEAEDVTHERDLAASEERRQEEILDLRRQDMNLRREEAAARRADREVDAEEAALRRRKLEVEIAALESEEADPFWAALPDDLQPSMAIDWYIDQINPDATPAEREALRAEIIRRQNELGTDALPTFMG